ncbi:MAG: hypothetical protein R3D30_07730 [Hyphomicrobiales bacterium]
MTTNSEARPQYLAVRASTLDDPEVAKPALTIWIEARCILQAASDIPAR